MVLRCTHTFHAVCLAQWFQRSHTCPKCRDDPGQDMPGPIDPACEGDVALYDSFRNTVWSTICAARDIRLRERRLRHGPEDELDLRVMATRYDVDAVARVLNYTRPSIRSRGSACANHFTLWPLMASARQRKDEAEGEYLARVAARLALTGGAADHEDNEDDPAVGAGEDQHPGESPGALTAQAANTEVNDAAEGYNKAVVNEDADQHAHLTDYEQSMLEFWND